MKILKFIFFIFFYVIVHAGMEEHFKKAEGKSDFHNMRNVDFIYMINLDKRPEKFAMCERQLNPYGIYPYRFSAVNGWKIPWETINDIGVKYKKGMTPLLATTFPKEAGGMSSHEFMSEIGKTYFVRGMEYGVIGCYLSHLSILQDALDSGYETIWVMEDDVEVMEDPNIISDLIDKLDSLVGKGNWDVLFTDPDYRGPDGKYIVANGASKRPDMDCSVKERLSEKYTMQKVISEDFKKIGARFATHSMIIRRSGMIKLLNFVKRHKIFLPIDLENYLMPINRYATRYPVVTNLLGAVSDIKHPLLNEEKSPYIPL
jgi:GR25 family glycosyltransferase involved in LPS biosynthesis